MQNFVFNIPYRLVLFAIASSVLFISAPYGYIVHMPVQDALETRGLKTIGTVEHIQYRRSPRATKGSRREIVDYSFSSQTGQHVRARIRRSHNYNNPLKVGDKFSITYLSKDPKKHYSDLRPQYTAFGALYGAFICGCIMFMLFIHELIKFRNAPTRPKLWPILERR